MGGSLNRATLVGNLAKDPESRSTHDGTKIVNLTLVTSERWKDRASGEWKEKPEFHRVVIFNDRIGELADRSLKKGSMICIEGSIQTRKWTDQQGAEKYTTEIVIGRFNGSLTMLDQRGHSGETGAGSRDSAGRGKSPAGDLDDEIPF